MITQEEYEDIAIKAYRVEGMSCSCHINPPCGKCVDGPSPEEYQAMLEYERSLK